jgi:nitric oxide reductase large subunit
MLGLGLMLFSLRALRPAERWRESLLHFAFWSLNPDMRNDLRREFARTRHVVLS